ncbi:MAG: four helix bundle protein [Chitinophagaceae bacterium]|nr:MAG: four helix bundle protein [Chitinophagaceae bacterium]
MSNKPFDLEDRLIDFAVKVIKLTEQFPITFAGKHLGGQLVRSGSSPALHYGEAQSAESRNDFIHKMKVCAKELKETFSCLKLIHKMEWISYEKIESLLNENNQLISIFVKSIDTARKNKEKEKNAPVTS